jgi:hypothetical protein
VPVHLILLDLTTITIFYEKRKLLSSSLPNFIQLSVTSTFLEANILLNIGTAKHLYSFIADKNLQLKELSKSMDTVWTTDNVVK